MAARFEIDPAIEERAGRSDTLRHADPDRPRNEATSDRWVRRDFPPAAGDAPWLLLPLAVDD